MEVIFPCAPYAVCQMEDEEGGESEKAEKGDEEGIPTCCPLTDFLSLNTTVTLYNSHNMNDVQVKNSDMLVFSLKGIF